MPFKNLTGDNDKNWLGEGISETVATELGSIKGLILIERSQLAKAVEELKLSQSGLLDEKTAIKVGQNLLLQNTSSLAAIRWLRVTYS